MGSLDKRKQILIISRYYPPEIAVSGVCVHETAKRLVQRGYQVTVLTTFPNYPTGIIPQAYRGYKILREVRDGVRVVRLWSYIVPNKGFVRRILAQLSFGCLAPFLGWKEVQHPDIIIVTSPPLFTVIAGRIFAWLKHSPLVVRIADLWPESAIQLGVLHNRFFIRLAEWLEWSTYEQANVVWVVTEGIRNTLVRRGLDPKRILLLTNGADITLFRPLPQVQARAHLGWIPCFTVLYAGNHGLAYSMSSILDVAEQLREYTDVRFVLVGEGVKKADLIADAQMRNLENITFLDPVEHERMPILIAASDVCLVPLRDIPLVKGSLPVKMFEIMACARPMIVGAEGLARQLAEQEAGTAICVAPDNIDELASAILLLRDQPVLAATLGEHGRRVAVEKFDYDQLTATLDARIALLLPKTTAISTSPQSDEDQIQSDCGGENSLSTDVKEGEQPLDASTSPAY